MADASLETNPTHDTRPLTASWATRGVAFRDTSLSARATITGDAKAKPFALEPPLPLVLGGTAEDFVLGAELGQGGMGIVFSARQTSLARDVAVKLPRPDHPPAVQADARDQILREALTAGALEHPGIIPVHALGRDETGRPVIVMKRIEGESWRSALDRDLGAASRLPEELLDRHFAILEQVANAIHYAHSRGVVHRDIKPDNVMLGRFGETYVVDWGIAVAWGAAGPRHLPAASSVANVVGTPAYMAPEMAEGAGADISPRTDVYLLGAVLHELMVGRAPHDADNVIDALVSAFASRPPVYPPYVSVALAALCHRAMAADPALRFADAGEFRDAFVRIRETQGSVILAETAMRSLAPLQRLVARADLTDADRERVQNLFAECHFGFVQALRTWPGNEVARDGLQDAIVHMITHELARDAPAAAELLLKDLPIPRPDLRDAIARVRDRLEAEHEQLRRVARDHDIGIEARLRTRILLAGGAAWFACAMTLHALWRAGLPVATHLAAILIFTTASVGALVVGRRFARALLGNVINRSLVVAFFVGYVGYAVFWVFAELAGISFVAGAALMLVLSAGMWAVVAAFGDRLMAVMVPWSLAGAALVVWQPDALFIWYATTTPAGVISFALLERRRRLCGAPGIEGRQRPNAT